MSVVCKRLAKIITQKSFETESARKASQIFRGDGYFFRLVDHLQNHLTATDF